jgi:hypothetical protein
LLGKLLGDYFVLEKPIGSFGSEKKLYIIPENVYKIAVTLVE